MNKIRWKYRMDGQMGNNDIKMGWRSNGKIKRGKGRNAMVVANGESINRKHKRKGERSNSKRFLGSRGRVRGQFLGWHSAKWRIGLPSGQPLFQYMGFFIHRTYLTLPLFPYKFSQLPSLFFFYVGHMKYNSQLTLQNLSFHYHFPAFFGFIAFP